MALSGALRSSVYRSALARIEANGGRMTEQALSNWLLAQYAYVPDQTYQAYQAVARQAIAATRAAELVNRRPVNPVPGNQLPVDQSIGEGGARYQYRVLITATSADGTAQWEYAVDLQSDQVLNMQQIRTAAQQQYEGRQPRRSYRDQRALVGGSPVLDVIVLAAGRRG